MMHENVLKSSFCVLKHGWEVKKPQFSSQMIKICRLIFYSVHIDQ